MVLPLFMPHYMLGCRCLDKMFLVLLFITYSHLNSIGYDIISLYAIAFYSVAAFSGLILFLFRCLTVYFFLAHFFSGEFLMFRLLFNLRLTGYA